MNIKKCIALCYVTCSGLMGIKRHDIINVPLLNVIDGQVVKDSVAVSGTVVVNGETFLHDSLIIDGDLQVDGGVDIHNREISVGNFTVNGDELVMGNGTVAFLTTVSGLTSAASDMTIDHKSTINGTFIANNVLTANNATFDGTFSIDGDFLVSSSSTTFSSIDVADDLFILAEGTVNGQTTINGALQVTNETVHGSLTAVGNVSTTDMYSSGLVTVNNNDTIFNTLSGNAHSWLQVDDNAQVTDGNVMTTVLFIGGDLLASSTSEVFNITTENAIVDDATLGSLQANGGLSTLASVTIHNLLTINGDVSASNLASGFLITNTLLIAQDAIITNTLYAQNLNALGGVIVSGATLPGGNVVIDGLFEVESLNVLGDISTDSGPSFSNNFNAQHINAQSIAFPANIQSSHFIINSDALANAVYAFEGLTIYNNATVVGDMHVGGAATSYNDAVFFHASTSTVSAPSFIVSPPPPSFTPGVPGIGGDLAYFSAHITTPVTVGGGDFITFDVVDYSNGITSSGHEIIVPTTGVYKVTFKITGTGCVSVGYMEVSVSAPHGTETITKSFQGQVLKVPSGEPTLDETASVDGTILVSSNAAGAITVVNDIGVPIGILQGNIMVEQVA